MTIEEIKRQQAICEAATTGPWRFDREERGVALPTLIQGMQATELLDGYAAPAVVWTGERIHGGMSDDDAAFVVEARTGYLEALADLKKERERRLQAESFLQAVWEDPPIALHAAGGGWANEVRGFLGL